MGLMMKIETYIPEEDEEALDFVHRVIDLQPDRVPLRIIEQLVEIVLGELKGRDCLMSAEGSEKFLTVTMRHGGRAIDDRLVWVMGDHTDRIEYHPEGDEWVLSIRRDVPPPFVSRR